MVRIWLSALVLLLSSTGTAYSSAQSDPWEGFNRKVFAFNETVDQYLLLPATKGYRYITPDPVERGVHNFFGNLGDVVSLLSNLTQLKFHDSAQDFARIVANTFFGLGGVLDVATPLGLPKQGEEFGQTLGYWGVPTGPYLVLPILGPSNVRDGIAWVPNSAYNPMSEVKPAESAMALAGLQALDVRSELMASERLISGDRYSFIRDAYLQRRAYLVNDGQIDDIYGDDGF